MRQRVDDHPIEFRFPVHVGAERHAGHADERDRLAADDAIADRHERKRGVVVAALEPTRVEDAHAAATDRYQADRIYDAVVGRHDDRAHRRGDIDAGVDPLDVLRDGAGHRAHEATGIGGGLRFALYDPSSADPADNVSELAVMLSWQMKVAPLRVLLQYTHREEAGTVSIPNDGLDAMLQVAW